MSEYDKVHFDKWQDLAKAVIDGREFFVKNNIDQKFRLSFDGERFNCKLKQWVGNVYIKKQPTLAELIAIKPRLCWVWDDDINYKYIRVVNNYNDVGCGYKYESFLTEKGRCVRWKNAQMLTDDEIKQFLSGE